MPAAFAGLANSPYGYYCPYLGHDYRNQATIVTNSSTSWAYTDVGTYNPSVNVPAGYMGALARMYKGSALCSQKGYTYNDTSLTEFDEGTFTSCGHGTYYSYGATQAYNGNGYNSVYTFKSPNQSN